MQIRRKKGWKIIINVLQPVLYLEKGMSLNMNKSFEEQIAELEKIINDLENGNLNLDDSVVKFEEGMKIAKECNKMLENAEKKITILLNDENGEVKEEAFKTE